jgi:hypothetical protein
MNNTMVQELHIFTPASEEEVKKLIQKAPNKSCGLDPLPTWLLKECVDELLPMITAMVNASIASGTVPNAMKCAHIRPLLKKSGLDRDTYKNYRPVSNLSFVSKLLEKIVAIRIEQHLVVNKLDEESQSAYRKYHSTETALVKVTSDILEAIDHGYMAILVLLDLSAAFDTIDHNILFKRLDTTFGIKGNALNWFKSYLDQRRQHVLINCDMSDPTDIEFGVPQGSVLGPKLYSMYTTPLGNIVRCHGLGNHFYADDAQIYVMFKPMDTMARNEALACIESGINDVKEWMRKNMLKLNDDKTEVITFRSKHRSDHKERASVTVGDVTVKSETCVRNLGVLLDETLTMDKQVNAISRSSYMHLRNIGRIRRYLTCEATKCLVQASVTSRLDYCNALLYGLPRTLISKLQRVQNVGARIITRTHKYDHITPVLKELHWLPINRRIEYKILALTWKALHGDAPPYIRNLLDVYTPSRSLRSQKELSLIVPHSKTISYGDRGLKCAAPVLWNGLPSQMKKIKTLDAFKRALKTHLFESEYCRK